MSLLGVSFEDIVFGDVVRDGRTYACKFASKIVAQTPKVTLVSSLSDEAGERLPFAYLELDKASKAWLDDFENKVIQMAVQRKDTWFKKELPDEFISTSFKSSIKSDGKFCVKIADDFEAYSAQGEAEPHVPQGSRVVALLELGQITFGRTEFGCLWKLKQVLVVPTKGRAPCMINYTEDESEPEDEYFL